MRRKVGSAFGAVLVVAIAAFAMSDLIHSRRADATTPTAQMKQGINYRTTIVAQNGDTLYFPKKQYGLRQFASHTGGSAQADSSTVVSWIHWNMLTNSGNAILEVWTAAAPSGKDTVRVSGSVAAAVTVGTYGGAFPGIQKVVFLATAGDSCQIHATD